MMVLLISQVTHSLIFDCCKYDGSFYIISMKGPFIHSISNTHVQF